MCVKSRKDISSYFEPVAIIHDKIGEIHFARIQFFTFVPTKQDIHYWALFNSAV